MTNPFSPEEAPGVLVIIGMRIYDVLLTILAEQNESAADKLAALHEDGKLLGPLPKLNIPAPEDDD